MPLPRAKAQRRMPPAGREVHVALHRWHLRPPLYWQLHLFALQLLAGAGGLPPTTAATAGGGAAACNPGFEVLYEEQDFRRYKLDQPTCI